MRHRLHIMPYTTFLEIQVIVFVNLEDLLEPFVCEVEQLVANNAISVFIRVASNTSVVEDVRHELNA